MKRTSCLIDECRFYLGGDGKSAAAQLDNIHCGTINLGAESVRYDGSMNRLELRGGRPH